MTIDQRLLMRTSSGMGLPSTIFNAKNSKTGQKYGCFYCFKLYRQGSWENCTELFYVMCPGPHRGSLPQDQWIRGGYLPTRKAALHMYFGPQVARSRNTVSMIWRAGRPSGRALPRILVIIIVIIIIIIIITLLYTIK